MDTRPDETQRFEPAAQVDDTGPTAAAPTSRAVNPGPSRARWLLGGGVAVAAIALIALAISLLGARPVAEALRYVPGDAAVVMELRPDLPGDQRQKLGNFLAHFPGFDDQAILDDKIDEVLERLVDAASEGSVDYRTQVAPVLEGAFTLSVSAGALGHLAQESEPAEPVSGVLIVATTDGSATCETVFESATAGGTHRDVSLLAFADGQASCALHAERYLLVGDTATVKAGLDARLDGTGIDGSDRYAVAHAAFEGDQLATVYVDGAAFESIFDQAMGEAGTVLPDVPVPDWSAIGIRAEDDALVFESASAPVEGPTPPSGAPTAAPAGESRFAGILPADTIGFIELRGVGAAVGQGVAALRADPSQAETLAQLEAGLAMLGGLDNLTGWLEEAGVAVLPTEDGVGGVLLLRGRDADAAAARAAQIRNLLVLMSTGTDVTVRDRDHNGVNVTTVDLGSLADLVDGLGGMVVPGAPPGELPTDVPDVRIAFSFAVRDDVLVLAVGEDAIIEMVLEVDEGGSLASSDEYTRAMQLAGATNQGQAYLAIGPLLELVEGAVDLDEVEAFATEVKPYLEPLGAGAWSVTADGASSRVRFVLTVK